MDSLDFDVYGAILSSLACHASKGKQKCVNLITERLYDGQEPLTLSQVDALIAHAEYVAASNKPDAVILEQLRRLPDTSLISETGFNNEWPLVDRLAYALATAALHFPEGQAEPTLVNTIERLADSTSDPSRLFQYTVPIMNGIYRALEDCLATIPLPLALHVVEVAYAHFQAPHALEDVFEQTSASGQQANRIRSLYATHNLVIDESFVGSRLLAIAHTLIRRNVIPFKATTSKGNNLMWHRINLSTLRPDDIKTVPTEQKALSVEVAERAFQLHLQLYELQSDDGLVASQLLQDSLELAVLCTIASGADAAELDLHIEVMLSGLSQADSPGQELTSVLPSAYLLMLQFPSLVDSTASRSRDLLLNPALGLSFSAGQPTPSGILYLTETYARAVDASPASDQVVSTLYGLFNAISQEDKVGGSIRQSDRNGWNDSTSNHYSSLSEVRKEQVTAAVLFAIDRVAAKHHDNKEVTSLCVTLLLQRLASHDAAGVDHACILLASFADRADHEQLTSIIKGFSDVAKSHRSERDGLHEALTAAHFRLADSVSGDRRRYELYLSSLLEHFVEDRSGSKAVSAEATTMSLAIINHALRADVVELEKHTEGLVELFRDFWFTCAATALLSIKIGHSSHSTLQQIASKSPCLIKGTPLSFVEADLEFNTILRASKPQGVYDLARTELSAVLSTRQSALRACSGPQLLFLWIVYSVEKWRSLTGNFASALHVLHNQGINSSHIGEPLLAVIDAVEKQYRDNIQTSVMAQTLRPTTISDMQNLALQCCHSSPVTRMAAMRYFANLVSNFPCLLCSKPIVVTLLEILTLLRRACESYYFNKFAPTYHFYSSRADISLTMTSDIGDREKLLGDMHRLVRSWLQATIARTPVECQGVLQHYIDTTGRDVSFQQSEMGRSVAIDLARTMPAHSAQSMLPTIGGWKSDVSTIFTTTYAARARYMGEAKAQSDHAATSLQLRHLELLKDHALKRNPVDLRDLLYKAAAVVLQQEKINFDLVHYIVSVPVRKFTASAMTAGIEVWSWIVDQKPALEAKLMTEIVLAWSWTMRRRKGIFDQRYDAANPFETAAEYTPTDMSRMAEESEAAQHRLLPHSLLLNFVSSRYQAYRYWDKRLVLAARRLILRTLAASNRWSAHPLTRELRFRLLSFGFTVLQGTTIEAATSQIFRLALYEAALKWFMLPAGWSYGSSTVQWKADIYHLDQLFRRIEADVPLVDVLLTSHQAGTSQILRTCERKANAYRTLLLQLLRSESNRTLVWQNPTQIRTDSSSQKGQRASSFTNLLEVAWSYHPMLACRLAQRFPQESTASFFDKKLPFRSYQTMAVPDLVSYLVEDKHTRLAPTDLLFWQAVPPIISIKLLLPRFASDPIVMQYGLRVLEQHPIKQTFFYVPQIVQGLRSDPLGYVERFIFEAASVSQLFCHQIIWNMQANCFKDDNAEIPDPMKPAFERMSDIVVASLSGEARSFYKREFDFFAEVTSISKKLQPFIKRSKAEKKAKIDEEMGIIKLDVGVYLPSNPDGMVIDISRLSGRPLQSHAKAPFMATFKVRREINKPQLEDAPDEEVTADKDTSIDVWQAAIFKVGDDCRQDVLALQIIAQFKNIFTGCGLDVYLQPYRVTATGPGQGVIDVVPNATSRDEMGRAKVNNLLSFFRDRFGSDECVEFQEARTNFIQSMAAYSVICYIIQIKDRHNGNIMIDGTGHITHVGLRPGGIKFEPNSFKLTHEMVDVMGGVDSPGYLAFRELTVKSFLACRPFVEEICATAQLMLETDLPSFKGEATIDRLRDRFKSALTEEAAASYMQDVIANAQFSGRSILYDRFQKITNDIPFAK